MARRGTCSSWLCAWQKRAESWCNEGGTRNTAVICVGGGDEWWWKMEDGRDGHNNQGYQLIIIRTYSNVTYRTLQVWPVVVMRQYDSNSKVSPQLRRRHSWEPRSRSTGPHVIKSWRHSRSLQQHRTSHSQFGHFQNVFCDKWHFAHLGFCAAFC